MRILKLNSCVQVFHLHKTTLMAQNLGAYAFKNLNTKIEVSFSRYGSVRGRRSKGKGQGKGEGRRGTSGPSFSKRG